MTTPFIITRGQLGLSLTDPGKDAATATLADYSDFSCTVTGAKITASTNSDTTSVPATFCKTGSEEVIPSSSSYALEGDVLQDPDEIAGLQKFVWDNASSESGDPVYFYLGLSDGSDGPFAVGSVLISELDFGGPAGEVLTASFNWPTKGRPDIDFAAVAAFNADD